MNDTLLRLQQELSELGMLISDTQDLLSQFPNDELILFQLAQLKHRQQELTSELKNVSISDRKQVLIYHYQSPFEEGISINEIGKSFGSLNRLMDSIAKKELSYHGIPDLELRAVVNQSFGLFFTSKSSDQYELDDYLGDINKTQQVLSELLSLTNALNKEDDLVKVFHQQKRHRDTISAINKFYESICSSGKTISIEWLSPFHDFEAQTINVTSERARYISNFIKTKKPVPDETISMLGELGGISIYRKRIEFLPVDEKKPIVIKWTDDMLTKITELKLKNSYHISCIVSSKYDDSTESLKPNYMLRDIKE